MCATPHLSRTICTGLESPDTANDPLTGAVVGGTPGEGVGVRRHAAPQDVPSHTANSALPARASCLAFDPVSTLNDMAIKDTLLAEYDHEMGTTRKLLDRLPDDKLAWRPHEKSMALGQLAGHLGNIQEWAGAILNESSFDVATVPPTPDTKTSRADVLDAFDSATRQARAWMDKSDAEYTAMWTLRRGDQEMFSMPRIAVFRSFILNHVIHHRGQLSVYLRLNDIPVPSIYGPSADEG
jgi:uncharacterized damage-inducible protein DinB